VRLPLARPCARVPNTLRFGPLQASIADVSDGAVFASFADPVIRAKWSAPSDTAVLLYDEANFAIGGRDVFQCGESRGHWPDMAVLPVARRLT
jgi:hypothetical protein